MLSLGSDRWPGVALLLILCANGAEAQPCSALPPSWGSGTSMLAAVHAHAATTDGTFIYAASGAVSLAGALTPLFQRYDPVANSWSLLTNVPTPVAAATLAYDAAGGQLFLFGGVNVTPLSIVQVYSISQGTWSPGPSMPAPRYGMSAGVIGGLIYLVGGNDVFPPGSQQSQNWEFDPASGTYTTRASLPSPVAGPPGAVSGGKLYVTGGAGPGNPALGSNYEYTPPPTDTWIPKALLPTPVAAHAMTTLGAMVPQCHGDIMVAGGVTSGGQPTTITQIYDVGTNTWGPGPPLSSARSGLRAAQASATPFATLIAFGGQDGASTVTTVDRIQGPPLPLQLHGFSVE